MGLFGRGKQQPEETSQEAIPQIQPPAPQSVLFETVLGPDTVFKGVLKSPGSVRLEGKFVGDLELDGNALIGEQACITADIIAANVTIAGAVRGNISGQRIQLLRTGRVWGDIEASSISTEDGAFIRGTITMRGGDIPPIFDEMETESWPEGEADAAVAAPDYDVDDDVMEAELVDAPEQEQEPDGEAFEFDEDVSDAEI